MWKVNDWSDIFSETHTGEVLEIQGHKILPQFEVPATLIRLLRMRVRQSGLQVEQQQLIKFVGTDSAMD